MIGPSLSSTVEEIEKTHEIPLSDVALILLGTASDEETERAKVWFKQLGLTVYAEDEFEGQEKPVVISVINGSVGDSPYMVSLGRER